MDLEKIKQFYIETWWMWALYCLLGFLACFFISIVFISFFPIVLVISVYFAVVRGPSNWKEPGEDSDTEIVHDDAESK